MSLSRRQFLFTAAAATAAWPVTAVRQRGDATPRLFAHGVASGDPLTRLRELYRARDPLYREIADVVVDTGRQSVQALTRTLLDKLGTRWKASA